MKGQKVGALLTELGTIPLPSLPLLRICDYIYETSILLSKVLFYEKNTLIFIQNGRKRITPSTTSQIKRKLEDKRATIPKRKTKIPKIVKFPHMTCQIKVVRFPLFDQLGMKSVLPGISSSQPMIIMMDDIKEGPQHVSMNLYLLILIFVCDSLIGTPFDQRKHHHSE